MGIVAILGGGNMGEALAAGLIAAGRAPAEIAVAETVAERRHHLEARLADVRVVPNPAWAVADAATVVVAVKPADVAAALSAAEPALGADTLVLSIAAGVTIAALEALVPGRPVVRAMPNTPALIGLGAAAYAGGAHTRPEHLAAAGDVLRAVGLATEVPEKLLDAVTGLSGSGPAYVFLLAEALVEAGVHVGLPRPTSRELVTQTLLGAATLLARRDDGPEVLRAEVTSPGGTTAAGLAALERRAMRAAVLDAVAAATERSRQLGS